MNTPDTDNSWIIRDSSRGGYDLCRASSHLAHFSDWNDTLRHADKWSSGDSFWPNLLYINDQGNVMSL